MRGFMILRDAATSQVKASQLNSMITNVSLSQGGAFIETVGHN